MNVSKHIGLLGLGSYTTLHYLQSFNSTYNQLYGGYSTCPLKLLNIDFNQINPFLPSNFDLLIPNVQQAILELNQLDVSCIVVPNMTLHLTIDQLDLPSEVSDKIVHPFHGMIEQFKQQDIHHITLLGTKYSMTGGIFHTYFESKGIHLSIPSPSDCNLIEHMRNEIYNHGVNDDHSTLIDSLMNQYKHPTIVCTELSAALQNESTLPYYDLINYHINAAIESITDLNQIIH